jgi:hypothetical protein
MSSFCRVPALPSASPSALLESRHRSRCAETRRTLSRACSTIAAVASTSESSKLGIAFPASAPGEGVNGRGLFCTGEDPALPLAKTPLGVVVCVPELVGAGGCEACVDAVRSLYENWGDTLGVAPPKLVVDFLTQAEMPKDLRVAVALVWATQSVPAWRAYRVETLPQNFDSLYLANDDELDALQDESVRRMAVGSGANYDAGWTQLNDQYPEVVTALQNAFDSNAGEGGEAGLQKDLRWARACAHTRAMSGLLGGGACAFVVPGVDLANHSFTPNTVFAVAPDGDSFQLVWDMEWSTAAGKRLEKQPPSENDEVLICYGARMPSALLMLHYGFFVNDNPNDQLPMELMLPGARKIRSSSVAKAGKSLSDLNEQKPEWAARQMMALANPTGAGDDTSDLNAIEAMRTASDTCLNSFPTTIEEDELLLSSHGVEKTMTPRFEMCVRYRLSQKRNVVAFTRFLDKAQEGLSLEEESS